MRSHHPANLISSDVHRNRIPSGPEKMTRSCQSHTQSWHSLPSTDLNCISVIIPSSCILKSRTKLQVRIASSILGIDFLWQSILLLHVCLANNCSGLTDGLSRYSGYWETIVTQRYYSMGYTAHTILYTRTCLCS